MTEIVLAITLYSLVQYITMIEDMLRPLNLIEVISPNHFANNNYFLISDPKGIPNKYAIKERKTLLPEFDTM